MNRVVNTVASLRSSLQRPTMSAHGVPISFVDSSTEPEHNPDAPPLPPDMPDHIPAHIDPMPDSPEEDEDDRPGNDLECTLKEIETVMQHFQTGYMILHKLREKLRVR